MSYKINKISDKERLAIKDRFTKFIRKTPHCWVWVGGYSESGYGSFYFRGSIRGAHRVSYLIFSGKVIPKDMVIHHICCNRACVNPAHLKPISRTENTMLGTSSPAVNSRKTHCLNGHPFDSENTIKKKSSRSCYKCDKIHQLRSLLKRTIKGLETW